MTNKTKHTPETDDAGTIVLTHDEYNAIVDQHKDLLALLDEAQ